MGDKVFRNILNNIYTNKHPMKNKNQVEPLEKLDHMYAVLKLSQEITYTDPFTREERKEKIQGIAGFIPCYATYEEAEEAACDGKFQIYPIKPA